MKAPSPKPITTMPLPRPRLSGNHFVTAATGVTYPMPRPRPPRTP